jgi:hypothetical protein
MSTTRRPVPPSGDAKALAELVKSPGGRARLTQLLKAYGIKPDGSPLHDPRSSTPHGRAEILAELGITPRKVY